MTTLSYERPRTRVWRVLMATGLAGLMLFVAYAAIVYGPGWIDSFKSSLYHLLTQLADPYSYR